MNTEQIKNINILQILTDISSGRWMLNSPNAAVKFNFVIQK